MTDTAQLRLFECPPMLGPWPRRPRRRRVEDRGPRLITVADLIVLAARSPARNDPGSEPIRQCGLAEGCPPCCVEWFVALIDCVWHFRIPPVEAYWALPGNRAAGYIQCPACLGVPLTTPLE